MLRLAWFRGRHGESVKGRFSLCRMSFLTKASHKDTQPGQASHAYIHPRRFLASSSLLGRFGKKTTLALWYWVHGRKAIGEKHWPQEPQLVRVWLWVCVMWGVCPQEREPEVATEPVPAWVLPRLLKGFSTFHQKASPRHRISVWAATSGWMCFRTGGRGRSF